MEAPGAFESLLSVTLQDVTPLNPAMFVLRCILAMMEEKAVRRVFIHVMWSATLLTIILTFPVEFPTHPVYPELKHAVGEGIVAKADEHIWQ
jgi:hypothetical protein